MTAPPWKPRPFVTHPWGPLHAVAFPDTPRDAPPDPPPGALARLLPEEQAFAAALPPPRRPTWVAGRLALAAALAELGAPRAPLLSTPRGAPAVPPGFVGSISHKRNLAVALAAPAAGACLGVDVEEAKAFRVDVSRRILTPAELAAVNALGPEPRWRAVLARFSIKEAIYKALDPFVGRYVAFKEAEVDLDPEPAEALEPTRVRARLVLAEGEGPFAVEATWTELGGFFVSAARVRASS